MTIGKQQSNRPRGPFPPRRTLLSWAGIAASAFGATPGQSQEASWPGSSQVVSIPGEPVLGEFSIQPIKVATLSDRGYPGGAFIEGPQVHVTRDTTFFVTAGGLDLDELYFADRAGNLVERIGRDGEGPGEFKQPWFVGETESETHIIDVRLNRKTILRREDLEFVRSVRLPNINTPIHPVFFRDGSLGVASAFYTRERAGFPCHILDQEGKIIQSFGPSYHSPQDAVHIGALAASGDSAVWVAHLEEYRIELWGRDGTLLGVYERPAPWFRSRENPPVREGEQYTLINGLYEDERGRLWVHAGGATRAQPGRIRSEPEAFASIVEVLDPAEGRVLATLRQPGVREYATGGSGFFLQRTRYSDDDLLLVEIWANRLVQGR